MTLIVFADETMITTLQRIFVIVVIFNSGTFGFAADEAISDAPVSDQSTAGDTAIPPLVKLWEAQAMLNVQRDKVAHIVTDEDVLIVQSSGGIVTAMNAETGREMWTAQVGRVDEVGMPASSNADVVMIVAGPTLYALDKFSGKELFSYRLPSQPSAGPVITEGSFFIPLSDESLVTCSLKTLRHLERYQTLPPGVSQAIAWRFVAGEIIRRAPVAGSSRVAFVTDPGNIFVVDIGGVQAGKSKFEFLMQSPTTTPLTMVNRDQEYLLAAAANNRLFCLDMNSNGKMQWTYPLGQRVTEPITVIGDDVYIVGDEGDFWGLGLESGLPLQTADDGAFALTDIRMLVSVTNRAVYVIDSAGRLVTVNRKTGKIVAQTMYSDLSVPIRNSLTDRVYLSTTSGRVVCLKESGIDFPIYHQNPQRKPIMPDVAKPSATAAENEDVNTQQ